MGKFYVVGWTNAWPSAVEVLRLREKEREMRCLRSIEKKLQLRARSRNTTLRPGEAHILIVNWGGPRGTWWEVSMRQGE